MKSDLIFAALREELMASPSDRAVAVLGGSIVETSVKQLVLHAGVRNRDFEALIERSPANHAQTLAFSMGLIPVDLHAELKLIFRIRNEFAHSVEPIHFDKAPVSNLVTGFRATLHPACINGLAVELTDQRGAELFGGTAQRFRFITAVSSASKALWAIQHEKPKRRASTRLYIDGRGCYAP
jgi:hypothetical protein